MISVLLTRSNSENQNLANNLNNFSHNIDIISLPIIEKYQIYYNFDEIPENTNVILTSKFACSIIAENISKSINVWVVGHASSNILIKNPHISIKKIYYNISALLVDLQNTKHQYIYFSGNKITQDLNFAKRIILYKTEYNRYLDIIKLQDLHLNIIVIYSLNTAKAILKLFKKYNLLINIKKSVVISISKKVGEVFTSYVQQVVYPTTPDNYSMIQSLKKILENEQ